MIPVRRTAFPRPVLAVVVAGVAAVTLRSDATNRVLHEYVPGLAEASTRVVGGGAEGENPGAIRVGAEVLSEPELAGSLPTHRSTDDDGRNFSFTPDLETRLDGTLSYEEEFTPSIVPFKRSKVLDTVTLPGYRLVVGDERLQALPVVGTGAATQDRDLFWVTLAVELGPLPVPIPAAGADARILSYRAAPDAAVRFYRDGADNLYVVDGDAGHGARARLVHVTLLTDVSAAYFGAELPPDVRVSALSSGVREMPARARAAGLEVARTLGLGPDDTVRAVVTRLTSHFRSFEEADEALVVTGDVYKDLALGRRGVCRHRAFAFMVTANAVGLPTRYVQNDAHAFVEVELPDTGYLRIDLGGAAAGMRIRGAEDRPRHEPRRPDELPQPEAYRESYSQLASPNVTGAPRPVDRGTPAPIVPSGEPGAGEGPVDPTALPGPEAPSGAEERPSEPSREPTTTRIVQSVAAARRGTPIAVSGTVRTEDAGVPGALVEVSLSLDGQRRFLLLGRAATGPDGRFTGEFLLPGDLAPRTYRLIAGFPGDARNAPSQSAP